jgi:hypothetical protein
MGGVSLTPPALGGLIVPHKKRKNDMDMLAAISKTIPMATAFTPCMVRGLVGLPASLLRGGRSTGRYRTHNVTAAQAKDICHRTRHANRWREYERDPRNCRPVHFHG